MSRVKKILLIVLGVVVILTVGIAGFATKLYSDFKRSVADTYESVERTRTLRSETVDLQKQAAFSVLLLGIDTGDDGRIDQGRSDTMLLAAVSPKYQQTLMVSLERDTYTEIVGHGTTEKLNAAYAYGGPGMTMDTVEHLLGVPVDHYIAIDMAGLKQLVDALGGITVNNTFSFAYDGTTFDIGSIQLDGEQALRYSRMRYEDPNGNYGRQERQRKVIQGIVKKAASLSGVTQYQSILETVSAHMTTDLTFDEMKTMAVNYRSCFTKIEEDQLQGNGFLQDGISYQSVSDEEVQRVKNKLDQQLGLN